MLEFPRWKYVLVALVVLTALLFALPNVFGEDPALQVERKAGAPMDEFARQSIEDLLRKQQIPITRDYIDNGRLILVFNDVAAQLKARDTVEATVANRDGAALGSPEADAAGAGSARWPVPALPGRRQWRGQSVAGDLRAKLSPRPDRG